MITVRVVDGDEDLERWRRIRMTIVPYERAATVEEMRRSAKPDQLWLLAELDGELAGSGVAGPSNLTGCGFLAPRVLPHARRRGVGTELLFRLAEHIQSIGFELAKAEVDDKEHIGFAERYGFAEVDRQVEQIRSIGDEPQPELSELPEGIEIVSVAEVPGIWPVVYERVALEAFEDFAVSSPMHATAEQWANDWIGEPAAMFVALAGGEPIGTAGLLLDEDQPHRAELGLTAVRREYRGRGIASTLKRWTHAWAARNGITEVYTWTQRGNENMQRLNLHLGYTTRTESITTRATLPLSR